MNRPKDFDKVQAYEERRKLPAGGYVCEIKRAEETKSQGGRDMIKLALEIAEGEYKGYFFDEYTRMKGFKDDAKWPYEGTKWQMVYDRDGNTDRTFKGLITSIEAENVTIQWDDRFAKSITGAKVGVLFGEEETEYNGLTYWRTVPKYFCTCEDIRTGNFRVPKKRPLEKTDPLAAFKAPAPADTFTAVEEDIPF